MKHRPSTTHPQPCGQLSYSLVGAYKPVCTLLMLCLVQACNDMDMALNANDSPQVPTKEAVVQEVAYESHHDDPSLRLPDACTLSGSFRPLTLPKLTACPITLIPLFKYRRLRRQYIWPIKGRTRIINFADRVTCPWLGIYKTDFL